MALLKKEKNLKKKGEAKTKRIFGTKVKDTIETKAKRKGRSL